MEIKGIDHTLCNPIKTELWNDNHVKIATYSVKHPQISSPNFIVETDGEETPRNALINAIQSLKKTNDKFRKGLLKEVR